MRRSYIMKGWKGAERVLEHEKYLWDQGYTAIAGIDEVGRGCLFGDVVAAAVILPKGHILEGVNDSKKLSEKKRDLLFDQIKEEAISIGIGIVSVDDIEVLNIKQASRLAMKLAVEQLHIVPDFLLVDAENVALELPQEAIIHGDALSQSIAAASIIAKVTRDRMCTQWDEQYPEYGISVHKGYATKHHREMLLRYGPTPLHRKLFIRKIMAGLDVQASEQDNEQLVFDLI